MSTREKIDQLEKLGVSDFETRAETDRQQQDLISRLEYTAVKPSRYDRLEGCTTAQCARDDCCEPCRFRRRAWRLKAIPAAHQLFAAATGPINEVRFNRGGWPRPYGHLNEVSIGAVTKWNRWMLDKFHDPSIVAVGLIKVVPTSAGGGDLWIPEVKEVVAGVAKEDLDRALACGRASGAFPNHWAVTPVKNLAQALSNVLRQDVLEWELPGTSNTGSWPKKALRRELYAWEITLGIEDRVVRYGCDRHFNKLVKGPRKVVIRPRQSRPKPHWLKRHQYGYDPEDDPERV